MARKQIQAKTRGEFDLSTVKDRIKEFKKVKGKDLASHAGNWRDHPKEQVKALVGVLKQIGIADVLLGWKSKRNKGKLTVFDGHLRKELGPEVEWWVAITDLTDEEADFMLATLDTLTMQAKADDVKLATLLDSINVDDEAVNEMLAGLLESTGLIEAGSAESKEYDESVGEGVEMLTCPHCGESFPK